VFPASASFLLPVDVFLRATVFAAGLTEPAGRDTCMHLVASRWAHIVIVYRVGAGAEIAVLDGLCQIRVPCG